MYIFYIIIFSLLSKYTSYNVLPFLEVLYISENRVSATLTKFVCVFVYAGSSGPAQGPGGAEGPAGRHPETDGG